MQKTPMLPRWDWAKVRRVLFIVQDIDPAGYGCIKMTCRRGRSRQFDVNFYGITTFPAYDGTAVGVRLDKDHGAAVYNLCVGSESDDTCDCPGFSFTGHCKHYAAMKKLHDLGRLPLPCHEEMTF